MLAFVSEPIAVAASTVVLFDFPSPRSKVAVSVLFYDDAAATPDDVVAGGTRDIAVSAVVPIEGYGTITAPVVGASVSANPGGSLKSLDLGVPVGRVSVSCAQAVDAETSTHYRLIIVA